jgi:hypothetical protein
MLECLLALRILHPSRVVEMNVGMLRMGSIAFGGSSG